MNTERTLTSDELDAVSGGSLPLSAIVANIALYLRDGPPPPPCGQLGPLNSLGHPVRPC